MHATQQSPIDQEAMWEEKTRKQKAPEGTYSRKNVEKHLNIKGELQREDRSRSSFACAV